MGFRMRRSFSIVPGVRVNLSGRSVGLTVGGKYARTTLNSRSGTHTSVSLPGTGLSYTTAHRRAAKPAAAPPRSRQVAAPPPTMAPPQPVAPSPQPVRPGLLAPRGEKELFQALESGRYGDLEGIASRHPELRRTCMVVDAFKRRDSPETHRAIRAMWEELWASGYEPEADAFLQKYASASHCTVNLAPGISATLPLSRTSMGLVLAEYRQEDGDLVEAAAVVESLQPSAVAAVSLAELYGLLERWQEVVDLTDNVTERDDLSIFLLVQRGAALRELRHFDAAREVFKAALARRSGPAELRHHALLERGLTYVAEGKRAMARKDFEKILAEDGQFPGLSEALSALS